MLLLTLAGYKLYYGSNALNRTSCVDDPRGIIFNATGGGKGANGGVGHTCSQLVGNLNSQSGKKHTCDTPLPSYATASGLPLIFGQECCASCAGWTAYTDALSYMPSCGYCGIDMPPSNKFTMRGMGPTVTERFSVVPIVT